VFAWQTAWHGPAAGRSWLPFATDISDGQSSVSPGLRVFSMRVLD
jgi:hypothetical protein